MKRLFQLRNHLGRPYATEEAGILYFEEKRYAKQLRNQLLDLTKQQWFVSKGPDHEGYR